MVMGNLDVDVDLVELSALVRRVLRARCADSQLVEELVQDTLLRVATTRRQLDSTAVRAFAIVTARNLLISHARRQLTARRHAHRLVDYTGFDGPEERSLEREETDALASALDRLDPADRKLLLDHEVGDEPLATLAGETGTTTGAVAMRLDRVRALLRLEFVLAFRRVTLPTSQCRNVLLALSAGDKRRQRSTRCAEHLLQCATCATVSQPLVQRRRGAAAWILFPWISLRRPVRAVRASRTAHIVAGCVAVAAIAATWLVLAHRPNPAVSAVQPDNTTAPVETSTSAAPVDTITPTTVVVTAPPTTTETVAPPPTPPACPSPEAIAASDEGCPVALTVVVTDVSADEGFWSRTDQGQDLWVHLSGTGESPQHVQDGDTITITGTLQRVTGTNSHIPEAQSSHLTAIGFYANVPYAGLHITSAHPHEP